MLYRRFFEQLHDRGKTFSVPDMLLVMFLFPPSTRWLRPSLLRTLPALAQLQLDGDRQIGVKIVQRALEEPLRQIATNAGVEGATVVQHVKAQSGSMGYDANTDTYVDVVEQGIIDPTKVERVALQNAASLAGLLLTTEVLITEEPEEKVAVSHHHEAY